MKLNESLPQQFASLLPLMKANSREVILNAGQAWAMASAGSINEGAGFVKQGLPYGPTAFDLIAHVNEISLNELTRQIALQPIFESLCSPQSCLSEIRSQVKKLAACRIHWMNGRRTRNWQVVESILLSPQPGAVEEYILLSREYFESLCMHGDPIWPMHDRPECIASCS